MKWEINGAPSLNTSTISKFEDIQGLKRCQESFLFSAANGSKAPEQNSGEVRKLPNEANKSRHHL